jgi:S1-C subfamily serine protease
MGHESHQRPLKTARLSKLLPRAALIIVAVFLPLTTGLANAQPLPGPAAGKENGQEGVIVDAVATEGPAAKAGIAVHDMIIAVETTPVLSVKQILEALALRKPGDKMQLTIAQGETGAITKITMILGASPIDPSQAYMGLTVNVGFLLLVPQGRPPVQKQQPPET